MNYYENIKPSQPEEYSLIPDHLQIALSNRNYHSQLLKIVAESKTTNQWILVQEVNIGNNIYNAFYASFQPQNSETLVIKSAENIHKEIPDKKIKLSKNKYDYLFAVINGEKIENFTDFSQWDSVYDGTTYYLTIANGNNLQRLAIYGLLEESQFGRQIAEILNIIKYGEKLPFNWGWKGTDDALYYKKLGKEYDNIFQILDEAMSNKTYKFAIEKIEHINKSTPKWILIQKIEPNDKSYISYFASFPEDKTKAIILKTGIHENEKIIKQPINQKSLITQIEKIYSQIVNHDIITLPLLYNKKKNNSFYFITISDKNFICRQLIINFNNDKFSKDISEIISIIEKSL